MTQHANTPRDQTRTPAAKRAAIQRRQTYHTESRIYTRLMSTGAPNR